MRKRCRSNAQRHPMIRVVLALAVLVNTEHLVNVVIDHNMVVSLTWLAGDEAVF